MSENHSGVDWYKRYLEVSKEYNKSTWAQRQLSILRDMISDRVSGDISRPLSQVLVLKELNRILDGMK